MILGFKKDKSRFRICVGFGEFEGKCGRQAGTKWTDYWCLRCDRLRRTHVGAQLRDLVDNWGKE